MRAFSKGRPKSRQPGSCMVASRIRKLFLAPNDDRFYRSDINFSIGRRKDLLVSFLEDTSSKAYDRVREYLEVLFETFRPV